MEQTNEKACSLANYAMRRSDEDTRNATYQAMTGRFTSVAVALDSAWYEKLGFETMTSLAIFLGKDYYDRFGEHFDIATYSKALGPVIDR